MRDFSFSACGVFSALKRFLPLKCILLFALIFFLGLLPFPVFSQNAAFEKALSYADSVFALNEYENALGAYKYAARMNPDHTGIKKKMAEINSILAQDEAREKEFTDLIAQAKKALYEDDLTKARSLLQNALDIKEEDAFALKKIKEIDATIAENEAKEAKYQEFISKGDNALSKEEFEHARAFFNDAAALFPKRPDPPALLKLVEAAEKAKLDNFESLLAQADELYRSDKISEALPIYKKASEIFPDDGRPKQKIHQIEMILAYEVEDQKKYDAFIVEADALYGNKSWQKALEKYQQALDVKPKGEHALDRKSEIEGLLEQLAQKEQDYKTKIAEAEAFEKDEDWQNALTSFQDASQIKPEEDYPKGKIAALEEILAQIEAIENSYNEAIAQADEAFGKEEWPAAKSAYQNALTIKSEETYPQEQIKLIDQKIKALADQDAAYEEAIAQADAAFAKEEWPAAKSAYQNALTIKSEETYPQEQIKLIDQKIKALADQDAAYEEAIAQADAAFGKKEWPAAKSAYQNALTIKSEETYPQEQIKLIDQKIKQLADQDAAYNEAIAQADEAFGKEEWPAAKSAYQNALSIKSEETYPQQQIKLIDQKIKQLADQDAAYNEAIAQADEAFGKEEWPAAKSAYQNALTIKSEETYPQQQIKLIDQKIKQLADQDAAYNEAIAQADEAFGKEEWPEAKTAYQNALTIKSEETYPQQQIKLIDQKIKALADQDAAYEEAIAQADEAFGKEEWPAAKSAYQNALTIKSEETYPQEQIKLIDQKIKALADQDAAYNEAIAQADEAFGKEEWPAAKSAYQNALSIKSEETYPQQQIKLIDQKIKQLADQDAAYNEAIAQADEAFGKEEWPEAKTAYQNALTIKSEETYPQQQIKLIDQKIKALADQDAAYEEAIAQADEAFGKEEWPAAKSAYQNALTIKSEETYPQEQIKLIDQKIKALADQDAAYEEAIAQADAAFGKKEWPAAKTAYQNALSIKSEETYPQEQIKLIDQKIKALADQDAAYEEAIAQADAAFGKEEWPAAKSAYQNALTIKSEETYPQEQIKLIDQKIKALADQDAAYEEAVTLADAAFGKEEWPEAKTAYQNALTIKSEETYPQQQIQLIDQKIKALADQDAAYEEAIAQADEAFGKEEWPAAKSAYQNALTIKSEETYPQEQIKLIDQKIKALADQDAAYEEAIAQADKAFGKKEWPAAKTAYQNALSIKSEETYPQEQIKLIDQKIKALADQDAAYEEAIAQADEAFGKEEWPEAKTAYQNALTIKSEETYPQQQIQIIDQKIKALADQDAAYEEAIAQADAAFGKEEWPAAKSAYQNALTIKSEETYPQQQIQLIDQKIKALADQDAAYEEAIAQADEAFGKEEWPAAKSAYQNALTIKSEETYPQQQIKLIDQKIKQLADQDAAYEEAIAQADEAFGKEEWPAAKSAYQNALTIKSEETYPQQQIQLIDQKIKALADQDAAYEEAIAQADEAFGKEDFETASRFYQNSLEIKPEENYARLKLQEINSIRQQQLQAIEDAYKQALADAEKLYLNNKLEPAIGYYEKAIELKPGDEFAQSRIKSLQEMITAQKQKENRYANFILQADKYFKNENWQESLINYDSALAVKPREEYPQKQIDKINDILSEKQATDEAYNQFISQADQFFADESLRQSIETYTKALELKAHEKYPAEQITKAKNLIAQNKEYESYISKADGMFALEQWTDARKDYERALSVKPKSTYAQAQIQKISDIESEIAERENEYIKHITEADAHFAAQAWAYAADAYEAASAIKPEEQYPKEQILKINDKLAAIEAERKARFEQLMLLARNQKEAEQYEDALSNAVLALEIYPGKSEASNLKKEIEQIIADIKAREARFTSIVAQGDDAMNRELWDEAIGAFKSALEIKPDHTNTQSKLELCLQKAEAARLAQLEADYKLHIDNGDQLLKKQDYTEALKEYQLASRLKQDELYPQNKISWLENLLREMREKEKAYRESIAKADALFDEKQYREARMEYYNATTIKPDELYPRDQMKKLYELLAFDPAKIRKLFDEYVETGDTYFEKGKYAKANYNYQNAAYLIPEEEYPYLQVERINKLLMSGEIKALSQNSITIPADSSVAFTLKDYEGFEPGAPLYLVVKVNYKAGIKAHELVVNFGRSGMVYGGTILNVENNRRLQTYVINLGTQSYWMEANVNWIRLHSELESTEIQYLVLGETP